MPTSVTIHHSAWGEDRYIALARYAGYVDADYALIKMARVWSLCTELGTDTPPVDRIATCLMVDDVIGTLVRARLGELLEDGQIRVKGCDGRIGWYAELPSQQAAAGKKRAQGAPRDARGRLVKAPAPTSGSSAHEPPAGEPLAAAGVQRSSALVKSASAIQRSPASEPELDLPDSAHMGPDGGAGSGSSGASGSGLPGDLVGEPAAAVAPRSSDTAPGTRRSAPGTAQPDPAVQVRNALVARFPELVNAARARAAEALGVTDARPIPAIGLHQSSEYTRELRDRLASSVNPEADMLHVIAMAEAEAVERQELQWLSWSLAREGSWTAKLAASATSRRGPRPRPQREESAFEFIDRNGAERDAARRKGDA